MFEIHQFVSDLEKTVGKIWLGGAVEWADENYNNAWSNAIIRFDSALAEARETGDFTKLEYEADLYKTVILKLAKRYRTQKEGKQIDLLLYKNEKGNENESEK